MTSQAGESLVFRPYLESDIAFIRSSWANSFYKGVQAHKILSNPEFHTFHRPTIDRFFSRPTATAIVVHLENEPDIILGWIAVEVLINHLVIHYIYVKSDFKKIGLSTKLINRVNSKNQRIIVTHLTDKAKRILSTNSNYKSFTYIPQLT